MQHSSWTYYLRAFCILCPMFTSMQVSHARDVDLSKVPDRLPDMVAGQTIQLDVSKATATGGLRAVRWTLKPSLASRRYDLIIAGDNRDIKDPRVWSFTAPSLAKDTVLNLELTGIANSKNENGKRYKSTKTIQVLVRAGLGKVKAQIDVTKSNNTLSFDATASRSSNGKIIKYIWRQTEGPLLEIENFNSVLNVDVPSFENEDIGAYANDLSPRLPVPSPRNVIIPNGLKNHLEFTYKGAFRVDGKAGKEGKASFSPSVIGVNPENTSIFVAGSRGTIAEIEIPSELGFAEEANELPVARVVQDFFRVRNKTTAGQIKNYVINGLLIYKNSLILTCEDIYDAQHRPWNIQVASNAYDLANSEYQGFLQLEGQSRAAGFMSQLPDDLKEELQGSFLAGWGSNFSIDSRYSIGPSLYTFEPQDVLDANANISPQIPTKTYMSFSIANQISKGANTKSKDPNDPVWGILASAHFGFIVPGTRKYIVFGRHAGLESGIGYKISKEDGSKITSGGSPYMSNDTYPYFWVFDLDDILNAKHVYEPRPISFGKFMVPYLLDDQTFIRGGSWNSSSNTLYLSLANSFRERSKKAPIILAFEVKAKTEDSDDVIIPERLSFDLEVIDEMGYSDKATTTFDLSYPLDK